MVMFKKDFPICATLIGAVAGYGEQAYFLCNA